MRLIHPTKKKTFTAAGAAIGLVALSLTQWMGPAEAQTPDSYEIAVSSVENEHIHGMALQAKDVSALIERLARDDDSVRIASSEGFDNGAPNGALHSHEVTLTKANLQELQSAGTVSVRSEDNFGHSHQFTFIQDAQCPAMAAPVPGQNPGSSGSPSPSDSPTSSPSVSPSVSPTVSPTATPTVTPTVTPTATPTVTPTATPTRTVTPRPTFTLPPGPIFTLPPRPIATLPPR